MFEELLRGWDGEFVASRFDEPTSTWMFVGVHSTVLGPGFGGTRMKAYAAPDDALRDALRLSSAMTLKNAVAGLPFGGGKAVLAVPAVPQGDARTELLHRYADLIGSLGGSYVTACDMNTTERDMDVVGERCPHVMGRSEAAGGSGTSAPDTAIGVFHGIRASLAHAFGSDDPSGRTVVVQGTGAVGGALGRPAGRGRREARGVRRRSRTGAGGRRARGRRRGRPRGGVRHRLRRVLAVRDRRRAERRHHPAAPVPDRGRRGQQPARPSRRTRTRLADAGILYAPDYVVNAGGVLHLAGYERLGWTPDEMAARLEGIGDTLREVFAHAERDGITTDAAARRIADERIALRRRARA